ncbi:MAG: acyl-CoA synthetase [Gammaproteobacteria bacterium]
MIRNFAKLWEAVADTVPDQVAVVQGARRYTWREYEARAARLAAAFAAAGLGPGAKVGMYLYNSPEYCETNFAALKMRAVPVNVNYRYLDEELAYLLDNADAEAVVFHTSLGDRIARVAPHLARLKLLVAVDDGPIPGDAAIAGAEDYETLLAGHAPAARVAPQGDEIYMLYTGGTTGMPKVAQHLYSGMIYNGWLGDRLLFDETDSIMCPLPMFHVFAVHVILMAALSSGAQVVFPTPQGYRGEGVFDNFWKLIERWQITFIITVPTAVSALMQRPVDADISSVKTAFSGSAPMPLELFKRFESASDVQIIEGYGLTEATCLVSVNPTEGEKKVGSVGIPLPYCHVKIVKHAGNGPEECAVDEIGEICVANPGVYAGSTYTEEDKNHELFHEDIYLRTGDLGRVDADGYLWITGRAKDLIIRGGHNIDPAEIEDALLSHPAVAMAGAIGQPDAHSGELPCAFVELVAGGNVTEEALMEHCRANVHERAAIPKHLTILDELPKTAVGKVFKPDLRKMAITRVYDAALAERGVDAHVAEVIDDKKRGLVARISKSGTAREEDVSHVLGAYTRPWEWAE